MKIKPTFDNVAVILDETENMTPSGIALPQTARPSDYVFGRVIAVGPGYEQMSLSEGHIVTKRTALQMNIGDKVMLQHWNAEKTLPIHVEGKERRAVVTSTNNIIAIIEE